MKRIALPTLLVLLFAGCYQGCMMPGYNRLIPENKDAHIKIYNPVYGYIEIDTRVEGSTNALPPLNNYPAAQ